MAMYSKPDQNRIFEKKMNTCAEKNKACDYVGEENMRFRKTGKFLIFGRCYYCKQKCEKGTAYKLATCSHCKTEKEIIYDTSATLCPKHGWSYTI